MQGVHGMIRGAESFYSKFEDLVKTYLGTIVDVGNQATIAAFDATENLFDTAAYGVGLVGGWLGNEELKQRNADLIAQDLLKSESTGKTLNNILLGGMPNELIGDVDSYSIIDDKGDQAVQSIAHMVGSQLLGKFMPAEIPMGVNAFGGSVEESLRGGATYEEAGIVGGVNAGVEILSEKIFGGFKYP